MANRVKVKPDSAMKARIDAALRDGISLEKIASDEGVRRQTLQMALLNEGIIVYEEPRTWMLVRQSDGTPLFGNPQETATA